MQECQDIISHLALMSILLEFVSAMSVRGELLFEDGTLGWYKELSHSYGDTKITTQFIEATRYLFLQSLKKAQYTLNI